MMNSLRGMTIGLRMSSPVFNFLQIQNLGYIGIFKDVHKSLQDKSVMLELLRWEIAEGNETTVRTAMLREMHTLPLANSYEEKFKDIDISAISALIIGGIYYLKSPSRPFKVCRH